MKPKFNAPNKITFLRVILIPIFLVILAADIKNKNILAAMVFVLLSISDFFDGYLARKKKQVTDFGKLIDPIADKLLIGTALVVLVGKGVELWTAIVIIAREVLVTATRIYLLPSRIIVAASHFGKAKTIVQSIAIVFVLLNLPYSSLMMMIAVILTVISGIEYFMRIKMMTGNKIVNLPNIITMARFMLIIPFIYYFIQNEASIALAIFATITLSDKLDGVSARLMNQKTELGSGLDSFTDWALIASSFTLFAIRGLVNYSWAVIIFVPMAVSFLMKVRYAKIQKTIPVTTIARTSVVAIYATIISFLINFSYKNQLMVGSIILVYASMVVYIYKTVNIQHQAR